MNVETILTVAGSVVAVIGSNIALIGWLRSDMKSFEAEVRGWRNDLEKEVKNFHGRLCVIEERVRINKENKNDKKK